MKEKRFDRLFSGIIAVLVMMILWSISGPLFAQTDKKTNEPKVEIKIKKQYDNNGKLIGYDSTYSWSWSGSGALPEGADSMFEPQEWSFFGFDPGKGMDIFKNGSPSEGIDKDFFNDPFWNGSPMDDSTFWKQFDQKFNFNFNMDDFMKQYNDMMKKHLKSIPAPSKDNSQPAEKSQKMALPPSNSKSTKVYKM